MEDKAHRFNSVIWTFPSGIDTDLILILTLLMYIYGDINAVCKSFSTSLILYWTKIFIETTLVKCPINQIESNFVESQVLCTLGWASTIWPQAINLNMAAYTDFYMRQHYKSLILVEGSTNLVRGEKRFG